jgi:hypothetical protein
VCKSFSLLLCIIYVYLLSVDTQFFDEKGPAPASLTKHRVLLHHRNRIKGKSVRLSAKLNFMLQSTQMEELVYNLKDRLSAKRMRVFADALLPPK